MRAAIVIASAAGTRDPTPGSSRAPSAARVHTRAKRRLAGSTRTRANPVCWSCPKIQSHRWVQITAFECFRIKQPVTEDQCPLQSGKTLGTRIVDL